MLPQSVAWLRELGNGWRASRIQAAEIVAPWPEAIVETLEVRGFRTLQLQLPARGIVGNGRGERGSPSLAHDAPRFLMINATPHELLLADEAKSA
jgi:hypothetical protein